MKSSYHTTVLLNEAVDALNVGEGRLYIDATLGGGGHADEILKRGGKVLGIDQDDDAIDECRRRFEGNSNIAIVKGNFEMISDIAMANGFKNCSGILFDLGTSVNQLKVENRGFSFATHSRLDMRMNKTKSLDAFEVVNSYPRNRLVELFENYGEEYEAKEIAEQIVNNRKKHTIEYTDELAELVTKIKKNKEFGIHPATKVFQAIRIEVNDELNVLRNGLNKSFDILESRGRIVVIAFHSLEDRIVKNKFAEMEKKGQARNFLKKPFKPAYEEIKKNKKARSAKMRVIEKI